MGMWEELHSIEKAARAGGTGGSGLKGAEQKLSSSFNQVMDSVSSKISLPELTQAIVNESVREGRAAIPWDSFKAQFEAEAGEALSEALVAGGRHGQRAVHRDLSSRVVGSGIQFTPESLRAADFLAENRSRFLTEVAWESRLAVSRTLSAGFKEGVSPTELARRVKLAIGLNERQAIAVQNMRDKLRVEKKTPQQIKRQTDEYARRLAVQRAETIARTETWTAYAAGQHEYWNQLEELGILDAAKIERQWITARDERTCPICQPMDGQRVGLNEPFVTGNGDEVMYPGAEVHPNDRCDVTLVRKG